MLTFAPKVLVVGLVLAAAGPWVLAQLVGYLQSALGSLVHIAEYGR